MKLRRILKKGAEYSKMYNDAIKDMINRCVVRALTPEELKVICDSVYYLPHPAVFKPDSCTLMRIVFDASAFFMGNWINNYWAKGPNILSNILAILLRFRQFKIALVADIKKMYNNIKLVDEVQHTHVLWIWLEFQVEATQYILLTVTFGDRPGETIASLALKRTTEMNANKYPYGADAIEYNMYVDDLLKSVETKDQAKRVIQEVEAVLDTGGFSIKHWVVLGKMD